jgi:hypothetical protein
MALQSSEAFILLEKTSVDHMVIPRTGLAQPLDWKTLSKLIQKMASCFKTAFIVVDALDECGSQSAMW